LLIVRRLAQTVKSRGQELPLERLEAEMPARRAPGNALGYTITIAGDGTFLFTRPDGTLLPTSPPLPQAYGDICSQHTADITPDTIISAGLADKFDLGQTIWATFANAQHAEQPARHQPQLAA